MNAIDMLGRLASISTPEQIAVYDKIIQSKNEFSFYSGVVSKFGDSIPAQARGQVGFDKSFKKNSMAWLLALARIEVAATSSVYGRSKKPFADMAPGNYGMNEYFAVLVDDLNAHVHALATDAGLKQICKLTVKADSNTLAYLRRLKLVNDMLKAVQVAGNPEFAYRAKAAERELNKYRRDLVTKVILVTQNLSESQVSESTYRTKGGGYRKIGPENSCRALAERLVNER